MVKEPSLAKQLFWDALEEDLLDDDTYPTCDMTDDGSLDDGFGPEEGNKHADCSFDDDDTPRVEEVYNEDGTIKESKYEGADIDRIVRGCTQLSQSQQNDLRSVLEKHPVLFNNELKAYPDLPSQHLCNHCSRLDKRPAGRQPPRTSRCSRGRRCDSPTCCARPS